VPSTNVNPRVVVGGYLQATRGLDLAGYQVRVPVVEAGPGEPCVEVAPHAPCREYTACRELTRGTVQQRRQVDPVRERPPGQTGRTKQGQVRRVVVPTSRG